MAPKKFGTATKDFLGGAANRWLAKNRSLVLRQTPFWAQSLAVLLTSLGIVVVTASIVFRIDEVVTVSGRLKSVSGTTDVKTPAGGKVAEVYFTVGQFVNKGDLLLKFDTTQAADQVNTLNRLITLESNDLSRKLELIRERKSVIEQKIKTAETISSSLKDLVESGAYQSIKYLQQLDQVYQLKSELSSSNLEESRFKLQAEKSISQMKNKLVEAKLQIQYQNVIAPVSGVLFDPQVAKSGVLRSGETIVSIVPQKGLSAEVFVPNKDIGFVKVGQKVRVRVDAFPFTKYGELSGQISNLGADVLPPDQELNYYRFPATIDLSQDYLKTDDIQIPLRSGMAVSANIKLREKRLISLVSDMLVDQTEGIKSMRQ